MICLFGLPVLLFVPNKKKNSFSAFPFVDFVRLRGFLFLPISVQFLIKSCVGYARC